MIASRNVSYPEQTRLKSDFRYVVKVYQKYTVFTPTTKTNHCFWSQNADLETGTIPSS